MTQPPTTPTTPTWDAAWTVLYFVPMLIGG